MGIKKTLFNNFGIWKGNEKSVPKFWDWEWKKVFPTQVAKELKLGTGIPAHAWSVIWWTLACRHPYYKTKVMIYSLVNIPILDLFQVRAARIWITWYIKVRIKLMRPSLVSIKQQCLRKSSYLQKGPVFVLGS